MGKQKRIALLDILRGFAVLGTLGTNIWIFAHLGDLAYFYTYDYARWWESVDDALRLIVLFFVNGKLLGLLTIMFGIGLELKYQQSLRKGKPWPGTYLWISFILIMEGFIHFVLVMEYDILMSYGVTAMIVSFIVKCGQKAMIRAMKISGGFFITLITYIFVFSVSGGDLPFGDMKEITMLYQNGTWLEQVQYRLGNFLLLRSEAIFVIPQDIFLFLLGVFLIRKGAFSSDDQGKKIRSTLLKIGLGVGIPLNLLIFVPGGYFDFPVRYLFAPILSLGYIALFAKWVEIYEGCWLWKRLENVGRMSLSSYVMQNILASIVFYGWGVGLGGNVSSALIVVIWLLICILLLCFASLWLRKFKLGPMEIARKYVSNVGVRG